MKNKNNVPSTIICNNDVELTKNEYYILYNFFVTHSLCNNQSKRKRTLKEYGIKRITDIEKQLSKYIKNGISNEDAYCIKEGNML